MDLQGPKVEENPSGKNFMDIIPADEQCEGGCTEVDITLIHVDNSLWTNNSVPNFNLFLIHTVYMQGQIGITCPHGQEDMDNEVSVGQHRTNSLEDAHVCN